MRINKPRPVRIVFILASVLPVFFAAGQAPLARQAPAAPAPLAVQQISPSLYLVKGGSGANAAFYVTPEGVFVIDAKMSAESAAGMLAKIKEVTAVPVKTLIITHSDGDHINGLPGFPKGLRIIAHEKCRADIAAAAETQPELRDYIPNKAYDQPRLEIHAGGTTILLAYFGPAHTSGDTAVLFSKDKAAFLGDLVFVGRDPVIHRFKGGRSEGCIRTLKALLEIEPPIETFLSGHADPAGRAEVEVSLASIEDLRARVKAMIDEGKTLEEIKKAFGIKDRPAPPSGRYIGRAVEVIYLEFTER